MTALSCYLLVGAFIAIAMTEHHEFAGESYWRTALRSVGWLLVGPAVLAVGILIDAADRLLWWWRGRDLL